MKTLLSTYMFCIGMMLSHSSLAESAPFGRIFNTPEQRHQLDLMRSQMYTSIPTQIDTSQTSTAPRTISVSGILIKNNGQPVIWIDRKSDLSPKGKRQDIKIRPQALPNPSTVIQFENKSKNLKPGQVWSPDSNQVHEAYEVVRGSETVLKQPEKSDSNTDAENTLKRLKEINQTQKRQ